ncbi:Tn3 family transposase [Streptomyces sp. NPDC054797]
MSGPYVGWGYLVLTGTPLSLPRGWGPAHLITGCPGPLRRWPAPASAPTRGRHLLVRQHFTDRDAAWWGQENACASDSKKFGSWSGNFMTEYHAHYGGNGAMPARREEERLHLLQLKSCSSSEVAAVIEGMLRTRARSTSLVIQRLQPRASPRARAVCRARTSQGPARSACRSRSDR